MPKITKRFVESVVPDPAKTLKYWDTELKGFGLLVLPSGRCTYCIKYRNAHRIQKHLKIGVHGHINTEEARILGRQYLGEIAHGNDPVEKHKEKRDLPLIKDLAEEYLSRHAEPYKRPRCVKEDKKLLRNIIVPSLGQLPVKTISRREIESLHLRLEKTPTQANRVLSLLSRMFTLAIVWEWRMDHPVKGITRYQEKKRDNWLEDDGLDQFLRVLEKYATHPKMFAVKILLLTGARSGEVFQATWSQFDLTKGIWAKPDRLTKQKKKEYVPLSEETLNLLHELKILNKNNSPYLFPDKTGEKPITTLRYFWRKIMKEANIQDFRVHDLRHTYASHLVSSGLSLSIVGKLLGHTQASTTQRYAHLADQSLRQATELFGSKVKKLISKDI